MIQQSDFLQYAELNSCMIHDLTLFFRHKQKFQSFRHIYKRAVVFVVEPNAVEGNQKKIFKLGKQKSWKGGGGGVLACKSNLRI
jgi:hypothetical protein